MLARRGNGALLCNVDRVNRAAAQRLLQTAHHSGGMERKLARAHVNFSRSLRRLTSRSSIPAVSRQDRHGGTGVRFITKTVGWNLAILHKGKARALFVHSRQNGVVAHYGFGGLMSLHGIGREGELRLTFARQDGRTILSENYSRPPLQVMRAIEDEAGCLCTYLVSPTGGVVQGDRYTIQIVVGANAHALFTTQSASKVYRMPDGSATQCIQIDVREGAVLEFVPDAAILFADADLKQQIEITLHRGALVFFQDIVMPGRVAMGERLLFRRYLNRLIVRDERGLLLHDASLVEPLKHSVDAVGILEGYTCWGSAYVLGDFAAWGIDAGAFCAEHQPLFEREGLLGALSPLYRDGIGARMVSQRLETIYSACSQLREAMRTQVLNVPATPLRK